MAELYVMIARLFRCFVLEIHDTTEERDVLAKHDAVMGIPDRRSLGIQARVTGEQKD